MTQGYREFYRGRTVMITGGLGFIGSNLARLLADLGADAPRLDARLRGPVGVDIGADSPESIALSIVADLQATLSGVKPQ